jgi:hypothetical protein
MVTNENWGSKPLAAGFAASGLAHNLGFGVDGLVAKFTSAASALAASSMSNVTRYYFARSTQISSLSLRTYMCLFANAGAHQTTSRPKALFVGSIT